MDGARCFCGSDSVGKKAQLADASQDAPNFPSRLFLQTLGGGAVNSVFLRLGGVFMNRLSGRCLWRILRALPLLMFAALGLTACGKGPDVPQNNCTVCIINPDSPAPDNTPLSAVITEAAPLTSGAGNYPGTAFTFGGTGNGGAESYTGGSWLFGDGTSGTGLTDVTHTYTTAGTYTVTFTVTDADSYTASTTIPVTASIGIEQVLYNFNNELWANSLITGSDGNLYGTTQTGGNGLGSVFKMTPTGVVTTLYNLNIANPADGCTPEGLTEGADGNFYGTTYVCGTNGTGNVFVVSPSGTETVLHAFGSSSTDGDNPKSGVIQAADKNFYGTTASGGAHGSGTVFMITPTGTESVLYSFGTNSQDGASPLKLIQGSDGNFYGTTTGGGTVGDGTVFKLTPAGAESILYSFGASTTDGTSPNSLLEGFIDDNFYGTTSGGGAHGHGTVFKITPAGAETVLYSFGASPTDGENPSGLLQASDGNLYGTTYSGGNFEGGTLFKLTPTGTLTMLYASFGSFSNGSSCSGGAYNPPNGGNPLGMTLGPGSVFYGFTTGGECSGTIPFDGAIFKLAP